MENAKFQRLRYHARKFGLCFRRVNSGYRFYRRQDGALINGISNLTCARTMTIEDVEKFISGLIAAKKANHISSTAAVRSVNEQAD